MKGGDVCVSKKQPLKKELRNLFVSSCCHNFANVDINHKVDSMIRFMVRNSFYINFLTMSLRTHHKLNRK